MMIELEKENLQLGVISDTHGLLRQEVYPIFAGVDYILHAGDIGSVSVVTQLEKIAPTLAILGNTDSPIRFTDIYDTAILRTNHVSIYMIHNIGNLDLDPGKAGFQAVIFGHSHVPSVENRNGVLFVNPGSAGPRRFSLPVSVARITITGDKMKTEIIELISSN